MTNEDRLWAMFMGYRKRTQKARSPRTWGVESDGPRLVLATQRFCTHTNYPRDRPFPPTPLYSLEGEEDVVLLEGLANVPTALVSDVIRPQSKSVGW